MADDDKWWVQKRPRGAIAYTNPDEFAKVNEFNRNNTGPLRMTSKPPAKEITMHAKGGPVGRIGSFGLKRSKPDFAGGGPKTNFKSNKKKGEFPW